MMFKNITETLSSPGSSSENRNRFLLIVTVVWALLWLGGTQTFGANVYPLVFGVAILYATAMFILLLPMLQHRRQGVPIFLRMAAAWIFPIFAWASILFTFSIFPDLPQWLIGLVLIGVVYILWLAAPVWKIEMQPGWVYVYLPQGAPMEEFEFVTRPPMRLNEQLITDLSGLCLPYNLLKLYQAYGAPGYMRDELHWAVISRFHSEFMRLVAAYPNCFTQVNVNLDKANLTYSARTLARTLAAFSNWEQAKTVYAQQEGLAQTPDALAAVRVQKATLLSIEAAVQDIAKRFAHSEKLLRELFKQSDEPHRCEAPLRWISTRDTWRLLWNKNEFVGINTLLDDLPTLENHPYRMQFRCLCQFEPDLLRNPGLRQRMWDSDSADDLHGFIIGAVISVVRREAEQFFERMPTTEAYETGSARFREHLKHRTAAFADMQIKVHDWSLECILIMAEPYAGYHRNQYEYSGQVAGLKELLEAGPLTQEQKADLLIKMLVMQNLPRDTRYFPNDLLNVAHPVKPELPAGNMARLPAPAVRKATHTTATDELPTEPYKPHPYGNTTSVNSPPPASAPQKRGRHKRKQFDDIIDARPTDDPDVYE